MGIQNLLKFMKPFIKPVHVKKYAGKRVGIDAYSWLHKGAYSCSMELCENSDSEKKSRYLLYFMHRVNLLHHHGVIPVVVFDGGNLPCKAHTEGERTRKRKENLELARQHLKEGNTSAAIEFFQKAVSITPYIAHQLIQILELKNVEFVVAPYEADAQLAYLSSLDAEHGGIAAVITEDSDLMAYGCTSIIFKMDRFGNGEEILLDKVFNPVAKIQQKNGSKTFIPSFQNFNEQLFTGMCVLAGCDFLQSVTGIGIRRAYNLVSKYKNLDRVLTVLKFDKGNQMPEDYAKSVKKAVAVFHHARIYDASTKTTKLMKPLPEKLLTCLDGDLDFLGPEISSSIAAAIAVGHLDPITLEAFDHFPKADSHLDQVLQKSDHLPRADTKTQDHEVATTGSCFTVFSSCQTRGPDMEVKEQNAAIDERKYSNEIFALQKLVVPLEARTKPINAVEKRVYPDNNPFKKRKLEEIYLHHQGKSMEEEEVLTVIEDDTLDEVLCLTSESQECLTYSGSKNIALVNNDEILCLPPKSQDSVNSKPTKRTTPVQKVTQKTNSRLKGKNTYKTPVSNNSSILNFFTRL